MSKLFKVYLEEKKTQCSYLILKPMFQSVTITNKVEHIFSLTKYEAQRKIKTSVERPSYSN